MFGDPSGMAPEKHKGGGDVLLGSGSLFKYLGLYSGITTASYAVVTHLERVLVGMQRYVLQVCHHTMVIQMNVPQVCG